MKGKNKVIVNPKLGEQVEGSDSSSARVSQIKLKIAKERERLAREEGKAIRKQQNEETCEKCDGDHDTKDHEKKVDTPDPRAVPTMVNLVKNKMRARGLKMSFEPELNQVEAKDPFADKPYDKYGRYKDPKARKRAQEKATALRNQDRQSGRRTYGSRLGYDKKDWDE